MVKANAYGHGLLDRANAPDADALASPVLKKPCACAPGGITQPILLLEGF
ncbi:MAG: alanine racemase [Enterobacteriaceae bacterium]